jgi:hypothetical protein
MGSTAGSGLDDTTADGASGSEQAASIARLKIATGNRMADLFPILVNGFSLNTIEDIAV